MLQPLALCWFVKGYCTSPLGCLSPDACCSFSAMCFSQSAGHVKSFSKKTSDSSPMSTISKSKTSAKAASLQSGTEHIITVTISGRPKSGKSGLARILKRQLSTLGIATTGNIDEESGASLSKIQEWVTVEIVEKQSPKPPCCGTCADGDFDHCDSLTKEEGAE